MSKHKAKIIKFPVSQTILGFSTIWVGGYFLITSNEYF